MAKSRQERPFNVYLASVSVASLDSLEGVPSLTDKTLSDEKLLPYSWQRTLYRKLDRVGEYSSGVLLAAAVAWVASLLAVWVGTSLMGFQQSPVSPILMTVILGLLIRNVVGLPKKYQEGLRWCVKWVLRFGVALLGLRLSLAALGQIGLQALPIVVGCIAAAIFGVIWLARLANLPRRLSALIAVGTSICGVSAIVATGPVLDADDDEISYAVAVITVFGMLALFGYPYLAHWMFEGNPAMAGLFLGTSIHDTSQVAGAGLMYQLTYHSPQTLDVAATTKLVRNLCMGAVIPLMAILYRRNSSGSSGRMKFSELVPWFVIAFVLLAGVRSLGDLGDRPFGFLAPETWSAFLAGSQQLSMICLTLAMASVGLGTSVAQLRDLGWKPLFTGLVAAVLVGAVSAGLIFLFAR